MRTIAVIPARFESKRLPGKPLARIAGKPLIQHVYERASLASRVDEVLVATDDPRIAEAIQVAGGEATMTSSHHTSGSDRVAEAVEKRECDLVVNVQGDEPLIAPEAIDEAIALAVATPDAIATLKSAIHDSETLHDPNVVKVVADRDGFALYFSRSPVPYPGTGPFDDTLYFKHIGLYVYPKNALVALTRLTPTPLERQERLEQLRALENGMRIRVARTEYDSIGVDTQSDLERVRALFAKHTAAQSAIANGNIK